MEKTMNSCKNTVSFEKQSLGLTGIRNARQLGGYLTEDGMHVRDNVLLRTSRLYRVRPDELQLLHDRYHPQFIVDFRSSQERDHSLDPEIQDCSCVWIPLLNPNPEMMTDPSQLEALIREYRGNPAGSLVALIQCGYDSAKMYKDMVQDPYSREQFHTFFELLLKREPGRSVLFHCTGGKDRAGLAAVLILLALHVDEETALQDFDLSNLAFQDRIEEVKAEAQKITGDPEIIRKTADFAGVNRAYMEAAIQSMKDTWKTTDGYFLNGLNLTAQQLEKLRQLYLQK